MAAVGEEIGNGGFGIVYRGQWNDGKQIVEAAFKAPLIHSKEFDDEIEFLEKNQLQHMFLVKYLGSTTRNFVK